MNEINDNPSKRRAFVAPDVLISMLTGNEKARELLFQEEVDLVTSDFALYEAVCAIKRDEMIQAILIEILFRVQIVSSPKIRDNWDRINHLRKIAKLGVLK